MATKRPASSTTTGPAKKAPAKTTSAKRAPAKKAPAKTTSAKRAPAKKAPAKAAAAAPTKKAPAKKAATAPTKKAPAKKAPAKAPAKKAPAKAPAKSASAGSPATRKPAIAPASGGSRNIVKKAPPAESPFDASFLSAQRQALIEERAVLASQAEALKAEADALARDREPGDVQFDDESGEGDTLAVERDFDLARAAAALQTIEEIDAAMERIEKGTYGICEYSGQTIPKERLRAISYARERVEFKTRSFR